MKKGKWYETKENDDTNGTHSHLLEENDEGRTYEASNSKEKVDELNPIILIVTGEENEYAKIAKYIHHATATSSN